MKKAIFFIAIIIQFAHAQTAPVMGDDQYAKTLELRVSKIIQPLGIRKGKKLREVHRLITAQYLQLNSTSGSPKTIADAHSRFLQDLGRLLNESQVDAIKDGMTYNVAPITYKGYQDMLPALTEEQKKKIWQWLVEAREIAMDAETSEKKHWWFGKYKGRINNYLSAEGYDLKKESAAWQKRIKSASQIQTTQ
jgi:Protein of unknown function (DUF3826)